ncbi:uncharacterized protein KRP23_3360 [Phytophthora ramorum]|uniref:uncharacterized protein n=1 Tax=Phytophthora ramorum TaxID=164328 RepID=UPI0030A09614|nr:hypothetical protein KRP23_3360 [Phytophthora ramorum]
MGGRPFYFDLTTTASARQFEDFVCAIDAIAELEGVTCFGKRAKHVVYGGTSEADVAHVRDRVLGVAMNSGIRPQLVTPRRAVCVFLRRNRPRYCSRKQEPAK